MTISELAKKLTTTVAIKGLGVVREGMEKDTKVVVHHVRPNHTTCIVVVNNLGNSIDDTSFGTNTVDYYYIGEDGIVNIFYK